MRVPPRARNLGARLDGGSAQPGRRAVLRWRVLVAVERLLIKLRQPASRADELVALRRRLRAERSAAVDEPEPALAREVLARKLAVADVLTAVESCRSCAKGQPLPRGQHDGGDCCAGVTEQLFDDRELAALAAAGTRPRDLVAPREVHAGCAFRGAQGCTLAVAHRPARCVHYLCDTLRHELFDRGQLDAVEGKLAALDHAMQRFGTVHRARVDREVLAPLVEAIAASMPARGPRTPTG